MQFGFFIAKISEVGKRGSAKSVIESSEVHLSNEVDEDIGTIFVNDEVAKVLGRHLYGKVRITIESAEG